MATIDHIAISAKDISASVRYYTETFHASVIYQDDTWAFLQFDNVKLALVTPGQHPPHVAIKVDEQQLMQAAGRAQTPVDKHRDGTQGVYIKDPHGNNIELINYPPDETIYKK